MLVNRAEIDSSGKKQELKDFFNRQMSGAGMGVMLKDGVLYH